MALSYEDKQLVLAAIQEACFARECEVSYDTLHPGVHEAAAVETYRAELTRLREIEKTLIAELHS